MSIICGRVSPHTETTPLFECCRKRNFWTVPGLNLIEKEITQNNGDFNFVRQSYIRQLSQHTGRNVVCYYSGWLRLGANAHSEAGISDLDKNGFMAMVYGLDRSLGLDLVLHTPGGEIEATRSIVEYLNQLFGRNIRVIVPQLAMSAGTMIACAANEIIMGKQSALGPTDPQIYGYSAVDVLSDVKKASKDIRENPETGILWQSLLNKYPPGFISKCERAVAVSREMITGWLAGNMFKDCGNPEEAAEKAVESLTSQEGTISHSHHFNINDCKNFGLNVTNMESDQALQNLALSVHHAFMVTFGRADVLKIMENQNGEPWIVGR